MGLFPPVTLLTVIFRNLLELGMLSSQSESLFLHSYCQCFFITLSQYKFTSLVYLLFLYLVYKVMCVYFRFIDISFITAISIFMHMSI